jgi:UDP-N-acetylglucosamine 2-epimerase (non-hydrolysing)
MTDNQTVMKKKILVVVGTRPNFIKVTRFKEVASQYSNIDLRIVHTGQHYDNNMADVFFEQFNLIPDYFLNIKAASPNLQIAEIMAKLEELINSQFKPDLLMVVGDVNSTLAGALTANKMEIRLAHIESGLRSFDRSMPEEINRILTDRISNVYFITEPSGLKNLVSEGVSESQIVFVGNTMIDTMIKFSPQIENSPILEELGLAKGSYVLSTLHRPATVDNQKGLTRLIELFKTLSENYRIIFPVHPRTVQSLKNHGLYELLCDNKRIIITKPLDYFAFQKLIKYSKFILTDSGGIQEESTFLGVPCLTLRENTERPVTCDVGSNSLIKFDLSEISHYVDMIENGNYKKGSVPELWDGKATERIFTHIVNN